MPKRKKHPEFFTYRVHNFKRGRPKTFRISSDSSKPTATESETAGTGRGKNRVNCDCECDNKAMNATCSSSTATDGSRSRSSTASGSVTEAIQAIGGEALPLDCDERRSKRSWIHNRNKMDHNWARKRPLLIEAAVKLFSPSSSTCCRCFIVTKSIILCDDCGPSACYCHKCFEEAHHHSNLHFATIWTGITFVPLPPSKKPWARPDGHRCPFLVSKNMLVIDRNGRQHDIMIETCPCEDIAVTLLKHRLWPASPVNPTLAIHMDLMEWGRVLLVEGHVSTMKFVDALIMKAQSDGVCLSREQKNEKSVYRSIIQSCVDEYRQYCHHLQDMKTVSHAEDNTGLDDGTACPACHGDLTAKKVISIDGNFGLVRKKSSGLGGSCSKRATYFVDQDDVDDFVNSNSNARNRAAANDIRECSDFQAVSALRSKGKARGLDEKGILGSACRHEIPLLFCSLKHGERFAYPVKLLQEVMSSPQMRESNEVTVVYDVACQLDGHVQTNYSQLLPLERLKFAIPVFHAYSHKLLCQLTKNLRTTLGVGLVDGETMERLWAYLRSFGPMTKEMRPDRRVDMLNDALSHYAIKQRARLGQSFVRRVDRAAKAKSDAEQEITALMQGFSGTRTADFQAWEEQDIAAIAQETRKPGISAKEDYALKLTVHYANTSANPGMEQARHESEAALAVLEQRHGFLRQEWSAESAVLQTTVEVAAEKQRRLILHKVRQEALDRKFYIASLRKYGIGQAISSRLSKQIKSCSKKIVADLDKYNQLHLVPSHSSLPTRLLFDQASDPEAVLQMLQIQGGDADGLSNCAKRQIVAAAHKLKRCSEEEVIIAADALAALNYFQQLHKAILQQMQTLLPQTTDCNPTDFAALAQQTESPGLLAYFFNKLVSVENEASKLQNATQNVINSSCFPTPAMCYLEVATVSTLSCIHAGIEESPVNWGTEETDGRPNWEADVEQFLEELDCGETADIQEALAVIDAD